MVRYAPTLSRFETLPSPLESSISNILELEIVFQRKLESLKSMNIDDAFSLLTGQDSFNSADVSSFLQGQGYEASEAELMAIIRRMDINGTSTISAKEFAIFLSPLKRDFA
jgi:Ca2+-binding EF-hand superfamily protein